MIKTNNPLKIIIVVGGFFCLTACGLFLTKREYKYAKAPVSEEQLRIYREALDSSYLFYRHWIASSNMDESYVDKYQCIRFFSDGRLQIASFDSIPNLKEIRETFGDYADYYKIEKGLLKMEVYRGKLASMGYWEGKVYQDSIAFYKQANTKWKTPIVYIKSKIKK